MNVVVGIKVPAVNEKIHSELLINLPLEYLLNYLHACVHTSVKSAA